MSSRYSFFEDRDTYVREQLLETLDDGSEAGKDLSAATVVIKFRMYQNDEATSFLVNETMTKITTGSTGKAEAHIRPVLPYGRVMCRIVVIDESTADAQAPSGYREDVWLSWDEVVEASVQPAP